MNSIDDIFSFIIEIEKLKNVLRKTKPVGLNRFENSGEHSWHVCLVALLFKEYSNFEINIDRVIKMLLIHDLGEIDAGDTIVYSCENKEIKELEAASIRRVFNLLPSHLAAELSDLWHEFEEGRRYYTRLNLCKIHRSNSSSTPQHIWKWSQLERTQYLCCTGVWPE
ncbi:HD domain-containing protein [Aeromonas veronii]|uniref:HD domain-containing protein n=1 Tax=Aeromonas veronii TaxID=654 RepID=UPI003B9FDD8E